MKGSRFGRVFGFYNGPDRPPIRSVKYEFGWFGRWIGRRERYFRHVAFGVYVRCRAGSRLIERALVDCYFGKVKP